MRRIFASEIWGAYFREGLFFFGGGWGLLSEFYGMSNIITILQLSRVKHIPLDSVNELII